MENNEIALYMHEQQNGKGNENFKLMNVRNIYKLKVQ